MAYSFAAQCLGREEGTTRRRRRRPGVFSLGRFRQAAAAATIEDDDDDDEGTGMPRLAQGPAAAVGDTFGAERIATVTAGMMSVKAHNMNCSVAVVVQTVERSSSGLTDPATGVHMYLLRRPWLRNVGGLSNPHQTGFSEGKKG